MCLKLVTAWQISIKVLVLEQLHPGLHQLLFKSIDINLTSGPSCSKLTMLLVNILLKLLSLNMAYTNILIFYICICKSYSHFFSKTTCELDIIPTRTSSLS